MVIKSEGGKFPNLPRMAGSFAEQQGPNGEIAKKGGLGLRTSYLTDVGVIFWVGLPTILGLSVGFLRWGGLGAIIGAICGAVVGVVGALVQSELE